MRLIYRLVCRLADQDTARANAAHASELQAAAGAGVTAISFILNRSTLLPGIGPLSFAP